MIVILFGVLFFVGILHTVMHFKQARKLQHVFYDQQFLNDKKVFKDVSKFTFLMKITNFLRDVFRHIKGKNRTATLKHVFILSVSLCVGFFINNEYLKVDRFAFLIFLFCVTFYAIYLQSKKRSRIEFESSFSEALNIINGSVSAGNPILVAIGQCREKVDGIVGDELNIIFQRLEIGEDVEHVFIESYKRLFYREYFFFIVTVLINLKGGGEIKEVINRLSKFISNGRIMERRKFTKTAEVRTTIKILMAIPIFFFFFLKYLSPENYDILLNDPTGRILFYYCVASELFGLFCVWSMMNKI